MKRYLAVVFCLLVGFSGSVHADFPKFKINGEKTMYSDVSDGFISLFSAILHGKDSVKIDGKTYGLELSSAAKKYLKEGKDEVKELKKLYKEHKSKKDEIAYGLYTYIFQEGIVVVFDKTEGKKAKYKIKADGETVYFYLKEQAKPVAKKPASKPAAKKPAAKKKDKKSSKKKSKK